MKSLDSFLQKALSICALYYLAAYCLTGALRLPFPGALAWLESNSYYQMIRVLAGQALFVEPSVEYVPFPYPPLYFYASAVLAHLTGPGFLPLRLVSYLSSLGSMALRRTFPSTSSFKKPLIFRPTPRVRDGRATRRAGSDDPSRPEAGPG